MYGLVLSPSTGMKAADLAALLRERQIETRPFFLGMHEQPVFRKQGLFKGERYPVAEQIAQQGLYLPSGLGLTEMQLGRVCDTLHEVLR
jgi:perosamine synthetase